MSIARVVPVGTAGVTTGSENCLGTFGGRLQLSSVLDEMRLIGESGHTVLDTRAQRYIWDNSVSKFSSAYLQLQFTLCSSSQVVHLENAQNGLAPKIK